MGIPRPVGLTDEQAEACDRFSLLVWGEPMFTGPSHDGRHGYECDPCLRVICERRQAKKQPPQPWEPHMRLAA